jgi:hypothetical protein
VRLGYVTLAELEPWLTKLGILDYIKARITWATATDASDRFRKWRWRRAP